LETSSGPITCDTLIAATGACARPNVPALAGAIPSHVHQTTPKHYRRPEQLPDGGVLVVGASASGVQIARELRLAGRPVVIAAGQHTRMPRRYRGLDIHVWLDLMGTLDRTMDTIADLDAARRAPSLQLAGNTDGAALGLRVLQDLGVQLAGRVRDVDAARVLLDGSLQASAQAADSRQARLLDRIDGWAHEHGLDAEVEPATRPAPTRPIAEPESIDLRVAGITSVVWATGYRPDFSWLDPSLLAPDGSLPQHGGVVTTSPGLYVLGLPFQRTRKSTFIDGAAADAAAVVPHLAAQVGMSRHPLGDTVPA
jgi:putative flavoprotein involved in K+ transport